MKKHEHKRGRRMRRPSTAARGMAAACDDPRPAGRAEHGGPTRQEPPCKMPGLKCRVRYRQADRNDLTDEWLHWTHAPRGTTPHPTAGHGKENMFSCIHDRRALAYWPRSRYWTHAPVAVSCQWLNFTGHEAGSGCMHRSQSSDCTHLLKTTRLVLDACAGPVHVVMIH